MFDPISPFLIDPARIPGPVLLTGAGGCIGAWVAAILHRSGVAVVGTDLQPDRRRLELLIGDAAAQVTFEPCDVTDLDALNSLAHMHKVTAIVHLAGLQIPFCAANPALGARVNVEGTINVFECARALGTARTVYASSVAALGMPPGGPWKATLYGAYKAANEHSAQVYWDDFSVPTIGLRPNVVYGVGRDQGMSSKTTTAVHAAALGLDYEVPFSGRQSWLYAGEAASAFIAAIAQDNIGAEVFDLNGPCESVEAGLEILGSLAPGPALSCSGAPFPFPPDLSDTRFRAHVAPYPNISVVAGIKATFEHFKALESQGRLPALPM